MRARRGAISLEALLAFSMIYYHNMGGGLLGIADLDVSVEADGDMLRVTDGSGIGGSVQVHPSVVFDDYIDPDAFLVYRPDTNEVKWEGPDWIEMGGDSSFAACRSIGGDTGTHELTSWGAAEIDLKELLLAWGASDIDLKTFAIRAAEGDDGRPFSLDLRGRQTGGAGSADSAVVCVAYDATARRIQGAALALRNADRLLDRPEAVTGTLGFTSIDLD